MPPSPAQSPSLAVMYHYVRPDASQIPAGIRPMLASDFERQLDLLSHHYTIAHPADFLASLGGTGKGTPLPVSSKPQENTPSFASPKPLCLLTFDDGTRDHAEIVTPILARRNLGAVFFILSGPAEEGIMPLTHAIHWLLSNPDEETWELFERYARDELHNPSALGDPAEALRIYHYESPLRARIKYAANMAMPQEATNQIVHRAVQQAGLSLPQLARDWFVSADHIAQMHRAGMTLGLHGHSHSSLQVLGPQGIAREIAHGSNYLTHLTGKSPTWWACPFGGSGASQQTLQAMTLALRTHNVTAAVTTQKSPVMPGTDPLSIPRYDCIDLPPRSPSPPPELRWS